MGKKPVQEAKTVGEIARCIKSPYRASLACMGTMKKSAERALDALERLEQAAQHRPSVLKAMRDQAVTAGPEKSQTAHSRDKDSR